MTNGGCRWHTEFVASCGVCREARRDRELKNRHSYAAHPLQGSELEKLIDGLERRRDGLNGEGAKVGSPSPLDESTIGALDGDESAVADASSVDGATVPPSSPNGTPMGSSADDDARKADWSFLHQMSLRKSVPFRVGDRVRITEVDDSGHAGKVGQIEDIDTAEKKCIVRLDESLSSRIGFRGKPKAISIALDHLRLL